MHRRKFYVGLLITLLLGGLTAVLLLLKPASPKAEQVDIVELINMFQNNEPLANATYTERLIEVSGVIQEISYLNNRQTILLHGDRFTQNFVLCDMSPESNAARTLMAGDTITLKGVCKGYLLDVILLNCTLIHEKTKN